MSDKTQQMKLTLLVNSVEENVYWITTSNFPLTTTYNRPGIINESKLCSIKLQEHRPFKHHKYKLYVTIWYTDN